MIPPQHIVAWREKAPWKLPSQVEQDLVLSRALVEIFRQPMVKKTLAFRGGTALHKLFGSPQIRYSEDLDLVQRAPGPIGKIIDAIRGVVDPWLGRPKRKAKEGRVILLYRFESEVAPVVPLKLKIEINTREHVSVLELTQIPVSVRSPWFSGEAQATVYQANELLGSKLRALYQRKKGRDLFDLYVVREHPETDSGKIVQCFEAYMKHGELKVSRAEFERNLHEKMEDPIFYRDVVPLLAIGSTWDREKAAQWVKKDLLSLLPGPPWKAPPAGSGS